jgi:5-formyltetrahydrofolate cyclo-ligase
MAPNNPFDPINQTKALLRERLKQIRAQVTPDMAEAASQNVWNALSGFHDFKNASGIGAFVSLPSEINTFSILEGSLKTGKKLFLPKTVKDKTHFDFYPIHDFKNLTTGAFGVLEPNGNHPADWNELDLVLVPGLAFDPQGNRLGFGKGYYDRMLPRLKKTTLVIGVAYTFQIVDQVPHTSEDFPMKALLTEKGFTNCKS